MFGSAYVGCVGVRACTCYITQVTLELALAGLHVGGSISRLNLGLLLLMPLSLQMLLVSLS